MSFVGMNIQTEPDLACNYFTGMTTNHCAPYMSWQSSYIRGIFPGYLSLFRSVGAFGKKNPGKCISRLLEKIWIRKLTFFEKKIWVFSKRLSWDGPNRDTRVFKGVNPCESCSCMTCFKVRSSSSQMCCCVF